MQHDAGDGDRSSRAAKLASRLVEHVKGEHNPERLDQTIEVLNVALVTAYRRSRQLYVELLAAHNGPDEQIDIHQLARLINRSVSTIRHWTPEELERVPGRRQDKKGGKITWSRRKVLAWLEACASS